MRIGQVLEFIHFPVQNRLSRCVESGNRRERRPQCTRSNAIQRQFGVALAGAVRPGRFDGPGRTPRRPRGRRTDPQARSPRPHFGRSPWRPGDRQDRWLPDDVRAPAQRGRLCPRLPARFAPAQRGGEIHPRGARRHPCRRSGDLGQQQRGHCQGRQAGRSRGSGQASHLAADEPGPARADPAFQHRL